MSGPDFHLLIGPEELLGASVLLGGHGGVSGGANLFPQLYVALLAAARRGDHRRVAELQSTVMTISNTIYNRPAWFAHHQGHQMRPGAAGPLR